MYTCLRTFMYINTHVYIFVNMFTHAIIELVKKKNWMFIPHSSISNSHAPPPPSPVEFRCRILGVGV